MAQEVFDFHVQIGYQCGHRLSFQLRVRSTFDLDCPCLCIAPRLMHLKQSALKQSALKESSQISKHFLLAILGHCHLK